MANKYKTEVGPVMEGLHYVEDATEQMDTLAFRFYIGQHQEARERVALLIWYLCGTSIDNLEDEFSRKYLEKKFEQFNNILTERNK